MNCSKKLSDMSSVSYGSIKRFETTGQISLLSLTKIATALGVSYQDIQEVINERKFGNVFIGKILREQSEGVWLWKEEI